jgi:hypothetical protein
MLKTECKIEVVSTTTNEWAKQFVARTYLQRHSCWSHSDEVTATYKSESRRASGQYLQFYKIVSISASLLKPYVFCREDLTANSCCLGSQCLQYECVPCPDAAICNAARAMETHFRLRNHKTFIPKSTYGFILYKFAKYLIG